MSGFSSALKASSVALIRLRLWTPNTVPVRAPLATAAVRRRTTCTTNGAAPSATSPATLGTR